MKYFKNVKSYKELKETYRDLLKKNHPDNGGNLETMQEINQEYDVAFRIWKDRAVKSEDITEDEKQETAQSTRRLPPCWQMQSTKNMLPSPKSSGTILIFER